MSSDASPDKDAPPEPEPEPEKMAPPGEETDAPARPKRSRFAPLLLLVGAIVAAITFSPHIPRERQVELRLEDASSIVEVEMSVTRGSDGEPVQGNAWRFAEGSAPASLRTSMSLPEGPHAFDVTVQRAAGRQSIHRVISLDRSDQITIPVR